MGDLPIIFSAAMVRALLDSRKTMTRRLAWRIKLNEGGVIYDAAGGQMDCIEPHEEKTRSPWQTVKPGDRLWVRENFKTAFTLDKKSMTTVARDALDASYRRPWCPIKYEADGTTDNWTATDWGDFGKGRPCIFMPRWASRLTLEVTATKIERLQDISEDDARAEGAWQRKDGLWTHDGEHAASGQDPARFSFGMLWEVLHGCGSWKANPEVVALTFTVHQSNIDAMKTGVAA